jgi:SpoVK/Ycf46/Vps4 family AAA+-type ATPase
LSPLLVDLLPLRQSLEELAQASDGFAGAEIEAAVKGALLDAFMDGGREVATDDVLRRVRSVRPTSEVKREEIEELRRWAREHLAIDAVHAEPGSGQRLIEF